MDSQLFFKFEIGALEGILDLKPEGKKRRVMKKVRDVKEKFDKDGHIEYIDPGLLDHEVELPKLKFQKSTTYAPDRSKVIPKAKSPRSPSANTK